MAGIEPLPLIFASSAGVRGGPASSARSSSCLKNSSSDLVMGLRGCGGTIAGFVRSKFSMLRSLCSLKNSSSALVMGLRGSGFSNKSCARLSSSLKNSSSDLVMGLRGSGFSNGPFL